MKEALMKYLYMASVFLVALALSSCASTPRQPSWEAYKKFTDGFIGKHEDYVLTEFGVPDKITRLGGGTRALVYTKLPLEVSPHTTHEHLWCHTNFRIDKQGRVRYAIATGTYCVLPEEE
jgi:hypothetical protein